MAHNLAMNNGKARMAYFGAEPWHKLGTAVDKPMTAQEAIVQAQLDYTVKFEEVYTKSALRVPDRYALVGNDSVFGIVSPRYKIIQNIEAFDFFDSVVAAGQAVYETAGALGKGERIWLMAHLPGDVIIKGNDVVERYLVLTNSHDGKSCLQMYFTPIRVVCQNTLTASMEKMERNISIRHTGNIQAKVKSAQDALGLAQKYYADFGAAATQLAETPITIGQLDKFVEGLFPATEDGTITTRTQNQRDEVATLFDVGKGQDIAQIKHTAWAAYNAAVEYADYRATVKNLDNNPSAKVANVMFGNGATLKQKAWDMAMALV